MVQISAREGDTGLERCFPPMVRDKSAYYSLEHVNADCHKFDVFVQWEDGSVERIQMVAFQDIYSSKILSWRLDHTPNEVAVMSAFGEMVETFGIPEHCTFDNGREFTSKWMSGGVKTRYRGKVREDDPKGVLPLLGIELHFAQPGRGQSKPIERAFRDLASDIAKDVRFSGAYVGNRPDAKPENYKSKAIPINEFKRVVAERIQEHNARLGRRFDVAAGRSFDEVFAESYAHSPIRRASDEQKRLWLMGQAALTMQKKNGRIHLYRNYYWSDWMSEYAGRKVTVRFDFEDLHSGIYIYELTGEFMGYAPCRIAHGYRDLTAAKEHARAKKQFMRTQRQLLQAERRMNPKELGKQLDAVPVAEAEPLENKIVAMPKGDARPAAARVTRPVYQDEMTPEQEAEVIKFQKRHYEDMARKEAAAKADEPIDRFKRAIALERKLHTGQPVGEAEVKWLNRYQTTSEYRGMCRMYEDFGDKMFLG